MKKILLLVLVLAAVTMWAAEFKTDGELRTRMSMYDFYNDGSEVALGKDLKTKAFAETRFQLGFTSEFSKDLKAYFKIEAGNVLFGGSGGQIGTKAVNVETKHLMLDYNCPMTGMNAKIGLQPYYTHNSLIFDDDMAGIFLNKKVNEDFGITVGTFKQNENTAADGSSFITDGDKDYYLINASFMTYGLDFIYNKSRSSNLRTEMWFAPYGSFSNDVFSIDGMFAYNSGTTVGGFHNTDTDKYEDLTNSGMALNVKGGFTGVENLTLNLDFLYLSGTDQENADKAETDEFNVISTYYMNGLEIFGLGVNDDLNIGGYNPNYATSDGTFGTMSIVMYGAYKMNEKFTPKAAFGMVSTAGEFVFGDNKKGTSVATEIDLGFNYKLFEALDFDFCAAMAMPGDKWTMGTEEADSATEMSAKLTYKF